MISRSGGSVRGCLMTTDPSSNSANGAMLSPEPAMIEVAGGSFVDLLSPDPQSITLEAVAHGLAHTCRYGGHVKRFYSVAEHSGLVHDLLRHRGAGPDTLRAALFHDAAEAFLGDVTAPLKWALRRENWSNDGLSMNPDPSGTRSDYDRVSERMDAAIRTAFGLRLDRVIEGEVALADMWALRIEARELTWTGGANWRWPGELPEGGELPDQVRWSGGLLPSYARIMWLDAVAGVRDA